MRNMVLRYCKKVDAEKKHRMQEKVAASEIFKGKKASYEDSIAKPFTDKRLGNCNFIKKIPTFFTSYLLSGELGID